MIIISSGFAKKWLQTTNHFSRKNDAIIAIFIISRKLNFSDNRDNREAIIAISRFALGPSTALCSLYGPRPPLRSSVYLRPNPSTAICPPLKPYVPSLVICPPPRYFVLSVALCPLYSPLPPLRRSVPSTALYPLYDPLIPQQPLVLSTALCPLYRPLSPQRPSVLSTVICLLYGPLSPL
jgi:hypothetical protein